MATAKQIKVQMLAANLSKKVGERGRTSREVPIDSWGKGTIMQAQPVQRQVTKLYLHRCFMYELHVCIFIIHLCLNKSRQSSQYL